MSEYTGKKMNKIKKGDFVLCENCKRKMPAERGELFTTCIKCTKQARMMGFMEYSHKTAPSLVMFREDDKNARELAERAFKRER